ncbi:MULTISPECIES: type IV secretory system conjugative DNA transfer family protein [unclassified Streptomyces]|nr:MULTISPECIES: type IV secretory system conjugative DNA transfer family protein [unclassified Streptomyces]MDF3141651.1 type IV secretory system conjugative DNA transfer family protein [Streptomyces sp. T21Q-yed]WDF44699.1 type IV secretory system conjugative DNA transfer family protein [Streptomyces sp. T12]
MTLLVWTATGLAAWFAHGAWPSGVTFTRTPLAMRSLIAQPHDIPGAWPETPQGELSGYGLFWGLFIGQLMVLIVLTVFVLGTVARWRAVRAGRRVGKTGAGEGPGPAETPAPAPVSVPAPAPAPASHDVPAPRTEPQPEPTGPGTDPHTSLLGERAGGWERLVVATRESRHTTAAQAVRDAEGPALVVTSNPALWQDTKDARSKLGPVLLYDPTHLCDTPARIHWSPTTGCEDKQTAAARATALLTPVRPTSRLDQAVSDTAETLLRSYLHAAAIDGRTIRHVHRWSQGTQIQDAVRTLRTNPKAAPGAAGELEAALTAHPERRDMAQELTTRALSALSTVNIRESCTPNRTDALTLDSFVHEGGTLYVVGESIEDPRANPGAMPLLTALAASVVERGRRMAERSSSGRLDPPLTLVLDDVAAVAPLPQLPELLATGADRGMPTLALLRSREQARSRWPHDELPV